jgi:hypothetical protein
VTEGGESKTARMRGRRVRDGSVTAVAVRMSCYVSCENVTAELIRFNLFCVECMNSYTTRGFMISTPRHILLE